MSFAEVKEEIRTMPRAKRRQLLAILTTLEREEGSAWRAEIDRRKGRIPLRVLETTETTES